MELQHLPWAKDDDVCGEAAGFAFGDRSLDLVVTYCADGTFAWEVIDDLCADERIAFGTAASVAEARRAAEAAGRRTFIRAA
ncbi:hypothetical protein BJF93_05675 [Xaviernesmea oryzae]|uniref:Uncharacterized protein n=1 Tax=Xaviernesmea oryzae TaxID=464029 RepID=A0A1Q9ARV9_9HYPH|nr:hypothetical protein [Xaviernesmea oryzae]OLP58121.1 hypothetical protein BJF93_05675 [Xaviernesmea oryzae]SEL82158.1 hypothetical protein SAMN04487976_11368 [Xaviernesmea oryzae]